MGRATAVVMLDEATRRRLERTVASASGQVRQVLRARIVLGAADGPTNSQIAVACATSPTVGKWRGRFAARGMDGMHDAERSGRPRSYGPEVRVAIMATASGAGPIRRRPGRIGPSPGRWPAPASRPSPLPGSVGSWRIWT
ncbi:helix-turn-helix domain-containing protein [Streptomyces sp. NPDC046977]|uniref:helix-turn-helix domain-containing protein n=1 Tax=Streptomyces sp. NPDC046977 TaxID=3154703 RepID=UPI0033C112BB